MKKLFLLFYIIFGSLIIAKDLNMNSIDKELNEIFLKENLAGMGIGVIKDGEIVFKKCYGYREIDGNTKKELNENSKIRVASISKFFTAIGFMKLVEEGKIDLDEDISKYLGFPIYNPYFPDKKITSRMLLSHISSIQDNEGDGVNIGVNDNIQQLFKIDKNNQYWQNKEPGKYFKYANVNFSLLGTIIEKVTNERFDLYMADKVFKSLNLTCTYNPSSLTLEEVMNKATIYRKKDKDGNWCKEGEWIAQIDDYNRKLEKDEVIIYDAATDSAILTKITDYVPGVNGNNYGPQGHFRASLNDLLALMQHIVKNDGKLLKSETFKEMFKSQWKYDEKIKNGETLEGLFLNYGLSTQICCNQPSNTQIKSLKLKGHLGEAYGFYGGFFFDENKKDGIIYLITGTSESPKISKNNSFYEIEEKITTGLEKFF